MSFHRDAGTGPGRMDVDNAHLEIACRFYKIWGGFNQFDSLHLMRLDGCEEVFGILQELHAI